MKKILKIIVGYVLFISNVSAQTAFEPISPQKTITPIFIHEHLTIDGHLQETAWHGIEPVKLAFQIEPKQGNAATHLTEVRVAYNHNYLYVGATCHDPEGKAAIRVPNLKRDFPFGISDAFAVIIDGFNDKRNAMTFVCNPYAAQRDLLSFDDMIYDVDWDGLWKVRTSQSDSGWIAEMAIPWQTLRYVNTKGSPQDWGINFTRIRRKSNEITAWSPFPRSVSAVRMNYAGLLKGISPPPPSTNIRFIPYTLITHARTEGDNVGYDNTTKVKYGGEIKWALNSNTILDMTFNTDFAQADADRQVNNLSRFSVFFPERRQFFLENAGLFSVGLKPIDDFWGGRMYAQPFFSRKIGLDANGRPVPIDVGLRVVSRSLKQNIGLLAMRQQATDSTGATYFAVGRYSKNLGTQHRIGAIATLRANQDHTNVAGGVDAFFRLNDATTFTTMAMASASSNGNDKGYSAFYQYTHRGMKWIYWASQSITSQNFNPEIGFVSRNDVLESSSGFYWLYRGKVLPKWIRAFEPGMFYLSYNQPSLTTVTPTATITESFKLIEQQININPFWITAQNSSSLGLFWTHNYQKLDQQFNPIGLFNLSKGEYNYVRPSVFLTTDGSKKITTTVFYEWGNYYDGKLTNVSANLQYNPIPFISFTATYDGNFFKNVGFVNDTSTEKYSGNVHLWGLESRLALNPRLQLISFFQHNAANNRDNLNIRLSWEYKPLSYIYLVFNQRQHDAMVRLTDRTINQRQFEQYSIAKISYLKQF